MVWCCKEYQALHHRAKIRLSLGSRPIGVAISDYLTGIGTWRWYEFFVDSTKLRPLIKDEWRVPWMALIIVAVTM